MKILIVKGCSKSKSSVPAPARLFYKGDIYTKISRFANAHSFDELIISGKMGLITPSTIVEPYDTRLTSKSKAIQLRPKVIPLLKNHLLKTKYSAIILIISNIYIETFSPIFKQSTEFDSIPVFRLISKRGIFEYKTFLNNLLKYGDLSHFSHYNGPNAPLKHIITQANPNFFRQFPKPLKQRTL